MMQNALTLNNLAGLAPVRGQSRASTTFTVTAPAATAADRHINAGFLIRTSLLAAGDKVTHLCR